MITKPQSVLDNSSRAQPRPISFTMGCGDATLIKSVQSCAAIFQLGWQYRDYPVSDARCLSS